VTCDSCQTPLGSCLVALCLDSIRNWQHEECGIRSRSQTKTPQTCLKLPMVVGGTDTVLVFRQGSRHRVLLNPVKCYIKLHFHSEPVMHICCRSNRLSPTGCPLVVHWSSICGEDNINPKRQVDAVPPRLFCAPAVDVKLSDLRGSNPAAMMGTFAYTSPSSSPGDLVQQINLARLHIGRYFSCI
jgi:hypothetical protein